MTTKFVTDEQLGVFARRSNELFRRVREGTLPVDRVITGLQDLIEGNFEKIPVSRRCLIDCDAAPYIRDRWTVEEHKPGGNIEFDPQMVTLYLSEDQKQGRTIEGSELRRRLEDRPVMNACVLDHLLANPSLIPEDWKRTQHGTARYIYFWGTIYRGSDGSLCVRCLFWDGVQWCSSHRWLSRQWTSQGPAALLEV